MKTNLFKVSSFVIAFFVFYLVYSDVQAQQTIPPPKVDIKINNSNGPMTFVSSDSIFKMAVGTRQVVDPTLFIPVKKFNPFTIKWTSINTKSCEIQGHTGKNGSFLVKELNADTLYTVNCIGLNGESVSDSVQAYVARLEMKANGQADRIEAEAGSSVKITWTSAHAMNCRIYTSKGNRGSFDFQIPKTNFLMQGACNLDYGYGQIYDSLEIIPKTSSSGTIPKTTPKKTASPAGTATVDLRINESNGPIVVGKDKFVLSWTSSNASRCLLNGQKVELSGSKTQGPVSLPTIYTIRCYYGSSNKYVYDSVTAKLK